jgi:Protein of unknown function (DUF1588)/Protein of unknown function (DUF1592)/Protein of unknown function (DUF1595)/Protein of unknown function (DUF1587)
VTRTAWLVLSMLTVAACSAGGKAGAPHANNVAGDGNMNGSAGAGGGSAGGPVALTLSCSQPELGKPVLRLLNRAQFSNTIDDIFPQVVNTWGSNLPADPVSAYGFDNDSGTVVGPQLAQAMLDTASAVADSVTGSAFATILPCSATTADRACAEQFVTQFGRRFFRRPITPAEHDRYLAFFDSALAKSSFKSAIKWLTVGLIQSPNAIYRSEIGTLADGGRKLDAHELATELAYTYTDSTPSDALLTQADSGTPLDATALAKNLLATAAGKATLRTFFEGYLDFPRVASLDRAAIPQWGAVRGAMVQETRSFLDQIVLQNGGGLKELLTSPTSNPSQSLAAYYGFQQPASDNATVQRVAGQGIGLLAQGSILASHAQPNGSSPTQRGLLVFSKLLCNTKPNPPANVPGIPKPVPGQVTTRQRYELQHAVNPPCSTCHKLFDPIGFGFEHFDEGGRYRDTEAGLAIDSASEVPTMTGGSLFQFKDQEELAQGLAEQEVVYQCFAAYLATYAFGTGEACLGASRIPDLRSGTLGIADYYAALAAEPHFSRRASQ